jgi:hypothetical protein
MPISIPGTLHWAAAPPNGIAFHLWQTGRWADAFVHVVKPELAAWARNHESCALSDNLFNGAWEGVQNALKHGAAPGGLAHIVCCPVAPVTLEVKIAQDMDWPGSDVLLDVARLSDPVRIEEGFGTFVILRLSSEAVFLRQERALRLRFQCPTEDSNAG